MEQQPTLRSLRLELAKALEPCYPAREAEALSCTVLEHLTGLRKMNLWIQGDAKVSRNQEIQALKILEELKKHRPIQYILGKAPFYGRDFYVNPAVLIPRPETEELVDHIIQSHPKPPYKILDIGTGSGCIAITLALHLPGTEVHALDISPEAILTAKQNATFHQAKVQWEILDFLKDPFPVPETPYDCIVSNPPYIHPDEAPLLPPNVLHHEPHEALFPPGSDPLLFYRRIEKYADRSLKQGGKIFLEINENYPEATAEIFRNSTFFNVCLHQDINGRYRMLTCQKSHTV